MNNNNLVVTTCKSKEVCHYEIHDCETIWVKVRTIEREIVVGCVYRHPKFDHFDTFENKLREKISRNRKTQGKYRK